jgi:hypothetical protein
VGTTDASVDAMFFMAATKDGEFLYPLHFIHSYLDRLKIPRWPSLSRTGVGHRIASDVFSDVQSLRMRLLSSQRRQSRTSVTGSSVLLMELATICEL